MMATLQSPTHPSVGMSGASLSPFLAPYYPSESTQLPQSKPHCSHKTIAKSDSQSSTQNLKEEQAKALLQKPVPQIQTASAPNAQTHSQSTKVISPQIPQTRTVSPLPPLSSVEVRSYETKEEEGERRIRTSLQDLERLEQEMLREKLLLEQLKHQFRTVPTDRSALLMSQKLGDELREILESKRLVLSNLVPSLQQQSETKEQMAVVLGELPLMNVEKTLTICTQPSEIAVANRYLLPAPCVAVTPNFPGADGGTLIVSVKLFYHGSDKEVVATIQGRQDILEGIKQVTVDKSGKAVFNKLKVMEVSSKHRHQSFCLVFSLDEYSPQGAKKTLMQVKSTPFHVQSRPAKRKRDSLEESSPQLASPVDPASSPSTTEVVVPKEEDPTVVAKKAKKKAERNQSDQNYLDITELLTLPQKDAARKLGISESMLCKRFKECTRRKWPYRYLRKIEKVINMLNRQQSDGMLSEEDQEKLQRLHKERDECLRPVRIRITSYDRLPPTMRLGGQGSDSMAPNDSMEEDIPIDALETLEMLKTQRVKSNVVVSQEKEKPTVDADEEEDLVMHNGDRDDEGDDSTPTTSSAPSPSELEEDRASEKPEREITEQPITTTALTPQVSFGAFAV